jgi:hypothetical protein
MKDDCILKYIGGSQSYTHIKTGNFTCIIAQQEKEEINGLHIEDKVSEKE